MATVLFVFPKVSHDIEVNRRLLTPPLGVLTLTSYLIQEGIDVRILDQRVETNFQKKLQDELDNKPRVACISTMSGFQIEFALEISKYIKKRSRVPTVWGGVHPSVEPESTLSEPSVDVVVPGDGSSVLPSLVKALTDGRPLATVKGICYKKDSRIHFTEENASFVNLDEAPPIPFHLVDLEKYRHQDDFFNFGQTLFLPIVTSVGCPNKCSFCTEYLNKHLWRAASPEKVMKDVEFLVSTYGVKSLAFFDDNFFVNTKRSEKIVDHLVNSGLGIEWYTNATANFINRCTDVFLAKLERSGLRSLTIGAESGADTVLKKVQKKTTVDRLRETNRKLSKTSIVPQYFSIVGFPFENEEEIKLTFQLMCDLLQDNRNARCNYAKLIPVPGAKVVDDCVDKGFVKPTTLLGWSKITNVENLPIINRQNEALIQRYSHMTYLGQLRLLKVPGVETFLKWNLKLFRWRIRNDHNRIMVEKKLLYLLFTLRNQVAKAGIASRQLKLSVKTSLNDLGFS